MVEYNTSDKTQCYKTRRQGKGEKISFQGDYFNTTNFFPPCKPKPELRLVSTHSFFTSMFNGAHSPQEEQGELEAALMQIVKPDDSS